LGNLPLEEQAHHPQVAMGMVVSLTLLLSPEATLAGSLVVDKLFYRMIADL